MSGLSSHERQTVEKAIECLTRAVQLQDQGSPPYKALRHYCQGLRLLLPLLASPRCSGRFRAVLRQKCTLYLQKSRHLQTLLTKDRLDEAHITTDFMTAGASVGAGDDDTTISHDNDVITAENVGRTHDDIKNDVSTDVTTSASGQVVTKCDNGGEVSDSANSNAGPPSTENISTKKSMKKKTRQVYCEVATVEVSSSDSDKEEAEAEVAAMKEAQEVEALARQFFTEEELQGVQKQHDEDEEDEAKKRQLLVQEILDTIIFTNSGTGFDDSWVTGEGVGLADMDSALQHHLVLPLSFPKLFVSRYRFNPYLLLYGHHGDGILALLRHLNKIWGTYQSHIVSGQCLLDAVTSGTVKESDLMKGLFAHAFQSAPCALCITDIEVFECNSQFELEGSEIQKMARVLKTELMIHMESLQHHQDIVVFVGVTSQPWLIGSQFRHRFQFRGYCPSPTPEERLAVFMKAIQHVPYSLSQCDLQRIAEKTSLFSRADMLTLADEAQAMLKLRVQEAHYFRCVFSTTPPPEFNFIANDTSRPSLFSHDQSHRHAKQTEPVRLTEDLDQETEAAAQKEEESAQAAEEFCRETSKFDLETEKKEGCQGLIPEKCACSSAETTMMTAATTSLGADQSRSNHEPKSSQSKDCSGTNCTSNNINATNDTIDGSGTCNKVCHRELSSAGHHDSVGATAALDCTLETSVMYMPCQASDDGAIAMRWYDIPSHSLHEPDLMCCDVLAAIHHVGGGTDEDQVRRMSAWHEDFGTS